MLIPILFSAVLIIGILLFIMFISQKPKSGTPEKSSWIQFFAKGKDAGFSFKEMLPSEKVLKEMNIKVGSIDIAQMLSVMNSRIAALYDREHTIGHSYFIPLRYNPSIEKLADIFMNKVIPLLQEYFYDDYEKIRLILGDNQKDSDDICFCVEVKNIARDLFGDKKIPDQYLYMPVAYRINDKSAFLNIGAYEYLK